MQETLPRHRQRTQDLCAALTEKALALGPDAKMPTVLELCRDLKTSSTTLNQALNELEQREILYRVRAVGIFVSPKLQPNIALIVDPKVFGGTSYSPFWDLLVRRAQERAVSQGENLSFHVALPPGKQDRAVPFHAGLVHAIENRQVDGIIAVTLNRDAMNWLVGQEVPLVAYASPGPFVVEHDVDAMIRMGVRALQERGCRRVAMWSPLDEGDRRAAGTALCYSHDDHETFVEALRERGLSFEPSLVRDNRRSLLAGHRLDLASEREQGYEVASAVFAGDAPPDGILITNDLMAAGAMKALGKLGVEAGQTVQVAAHANANSLVLADHEDRLIRLEFDAQEVTSTLFSLLEALMRHQPIPSSRVKVAPHLRSSSK